MQRFVHRHHINIPTVHIQKKERIYSAEVTMKVLWWTKKLWSRNWGLDKCVRPASNSLISSPYSSDPSSSFGSAATWEPIAFTKDQTQRIFLGTATAQSIAQEVDGVYTAGNNINYPGCGSALQCKKRV